MVAIDDYAGARRVFTIDDSSGACIECVAHSAVHSQRQSAQAAATAASLPPPAIPFSEIQLGAIVEAKGRIISFRDARQLRLVSLRPVRCTAHEVVLWRKRDRFAAEVLAAGPWHVDEARVARRRVKVERYRDSVRARMTTRSGGKKRRGIGKSDGPLHVPQFPVASRDEVADRLEKEKHRLAQREREESLLAQLSREGPA